MATGYKRLHGDLGLDDGNTEGEEVPKKTESMGLAVFNPLIYKTVKYPGYMLFWWCSGIHLN